MRKKTPRLPMRQFITTLLCFYCNFVTLTLENACMRKIDPNVQKFNAYARKWGLREETWFMMMYRNSKWPWSMRKVIWALPESLMLVFKCSSRGCSETLLKKQKKALQNDWPVYSSVSVQACVSAVTATMTVNQWSLRSLRCFRVVLLTHAMAS